MIYFDANATEPLRPAARDAAVAALALGNPASVHQPGRAARNVLESAREALAKYFAAAPRDVIFTSGATEANALAIQSLGSGRRVLIGATEHDAVRGAARDAVVIPVLADGQVDLAALEALLAVYPGALVCLMAANNETGVLHNLRAVTSLCTVYGALLHVDAAQAAARAPEDWLGLGAASIAISGHKLGGPMGAGALVLASGRHITAMLRGGGQEQGRRGGTPALPAIAGMAAALGEIYDASAIAALRDKLESFCVARGAIAAGAAAPRLPNTSSLALPGVKAETQLIALDLAGIAVSAGAACSSGTMAPSHVLHAMGFGAAAGEAIRVSLPWNASADDVAKFCSAYEDFTARMLRRSARCA